MEMLVSCSLIYIVRITKESKLLLSYLVFWLKRTLNFKYTNQVMSDVA